MNDRRAARDDPSGEQADSVSAHSSDLRSGMTWPPSLPFDLALARAKTLDERSLSLLYARFLPVVFRYQLARLGDQHQAEDLTAETFIAMVEQIARARAEDELTFAAWLLGIARNKLLMYYRARRSRPAPIYGVPDELPLYTRADEDDPLAVLSARESWNEVVAALDELTEEQRNVVLYRCVLGYSAEEVGVLLGKQAGAVRALQFRALATLARRLSSQRPAPADASPRRTRSVKGQTDE